MLSGWQWSWRPGCEALLTVGAVCELARRESTEATVTGMTPAQALAWSCCMKQGRWPLKEPSNQEMRMRLFNGKEWMIHHKVSFEYERNVPYLL